MQRRNFIKLLAGIPILGGVAVKVLAEERTTEWKLESARRISKYETEYTFISSEEMARVLRKGSGARKRGGAP